VRVVEATADGQAEMLLGEIGKAEVFGELGILRDQPRSATVIAVERTHCLVLRQADFMLALGESVTLANGLLRVLASRLYDADRRLARYAPDPLTGLNSRRAFNEQYRRIAAGARRRKTGVLLLALDVLHLKTVNDSFGYTLGDEVLRTVADALSEATRTTDAVARYGGDEFAVLLLDATPKDVDFILVRVHEKLSALALQRGLPVAVECSTGIAWSQTRGCGRARPRSSSARRRRLRAHDPSCRRGWRRRSPSSRRGPRGARRRSRPPTSARWLRASAAPPRD